MFNPVSQDYFDNPYEIYRRMRDEAPVYYDEEAGLLRADPARRRGGGVQGPRVVLVGHGDATWRMVRSGEVPQKSIIFMDPPDHRHMRSLLNKAFTPRAIQSQREQSPSSIEHYLSKARSRTISTWCRTSPAPSPSR